MVRLPSGRDGFVFVVSGLLVCLLLVTTVGGATAEVVPSVADRSDDVGAVSTGESVVTEAHEEGFDRTEFRITVHDDGSATWLFRYERTLATDEERADFEAYAEEFERNETDLYRDFVTSAESLAESGSEATGREMVAGEFERRAFVSELGNQGIVELSFRWDGFAPVEDDRVVVGDVFEGGLYIGPNERLVFEPGEDLVFEDTDPAPDDMTDTTLAESDSITWNGERSFTDDRPRVVFVPVADGEPVTTPTPTPEPTPGEPAPGEPEDDDGLSVGLVALFGAFVLAVALGYRFGLFPTGETANDETPSETGSDVSESEAPSSTDRVSEPGGESISDEELLPDDERVISLLEANGGRMKQVSIVEETDWSKSKVSMLLSELEEEGRISKLRVGRENIISLPGYEPDAANSPFEDDG